MLECEFSTPEDVPLCPAPSIPRKGHIGEPRHPLGPQPALTEPNHRRRSAKDRYQSHVIGDARRSKSGPNVP